MNTIQLLFAFTAAISVVPLEAQPCVSLTAAGSPYTQNFDTLASTGTSAALPAGWFFSETGSSAKNDGMYSASTGSDTGGDTYSYGASGSSERAFGMLLSGTLTPRIGACFVNNTGAGITRISIAYRGEQWRYGATGRPADHIDFQFSTNASSLAAGTWTGYRSLDFTSPVNSGSTGALNGNANAVNISSTIDSLNIADGAAFWIRWLDFDISPGSDDGLAVDDFSLTPLVDSGVSVQDLTLNEGDAGTTTFDVKVTLAAPAGPGGVTFDIATADGTALAGSDYVARSLTAQSVAEGSSTYTFTVQVIGDTMFEANESFQVQVTNVSGAEVARDTGTITIANDDVVPISQVQGSGNGSPYAGQAVAVRGIVTGRKSNGFFMQTPDGAVDADPATSEGIFVFTSRAPPSAAAVGNLVQVNGTVSEFQPEANGPSLTEIGGGPAVTLVSTGNALPEPVLLTAADTDPAGGLYQLEKYEGMRVKVDSLTAVAPTDGFLSEANATSTSDGVFYGVITGIARPFREPGIETPDPLPAGAPCCVPYWDTNPERLRVDSDAQRDPAGAPVPALDVTTGAVITNLTGTLDYGFRAYTIDPDAGTPPGVTRNIVATPVPAPASNQFTVASFNMERFYDTANDPAVSDVVLTPAAYANRLRKASLTVRNILLLPDIVAVQEMENLGALQDIANQVNNDAAAAGLPNPAYTAYLMEGNDVGGIDVGFLVKSARVDALGVTQEGKSTTYVTPAGATELLNDRPPLILTASVRGPGGSAAFPITVIANHLRSLNGIDDPADGPRVRAKRKAQAEFLADLIQARQAANPAERIVVVGDFNAFPFSDGYVDVTGTVRGTPTAASNVVLASPDLVSPDLVDASDTVPALERYSYVFEGSAQTIDQLLFTQNLQPYFAALAHGRVNADFPEVYRDDPDRPERLSDHDPAVAYFRFPPADLGLSITSAPAPVTGQNVAYTLSVTNTLAEAAAEVMLTATVPTGLATFQSLAAPAGWMCATPVFGSAGVVTCRKPFLASGASESVTLAVTVDCELANGTSLELKAAVSSETLDPNPGNNSAISTTLVSNPPPVVSAVTVDTPELWPPNGKLVDVHLSYSASDTCGGAACVVTVQSSEPSNALGDGNRPVDFEVVSPTLVRLRAERSANIADRIYTITVTCTDPGGGATVRTAMVTVPHSQSGK